MAKIQSSTGTTPTINTIVTIFLLIFVYPLGLLLVWFWTKWPQWLKILLSVLVVIPLLAILLAVTLIAINPSKQFSQANNTKRMSDISAISSAIAQFKQQNGANPTGISDTPTEIAKNTADICANIVPNLIAALPTDPLASTKEQKSGPPFQNIVDCTTTYSTGYLVNANNDGTITVSAPKAELDQTISVTR